MMGLHIITKEQREARKAGHPWRGLGDVIASATKAIGIRPCQKCGQRQQALNKHFPLKQD